MIAEIIINSTVKNLNKIFDYNVPAEFAGTIRIGLRVLIPFGRGERLQEGFIVGFKKESEYEVKDISCIQNGFCLKEEQIELAKWMARRYFCNVSDSIKMMLPPGTTTKVINNRVKEKNLNFVYLKKDIEEIEFDIETKKIKSDKQLRVLEFLKENDGVLTTDLEVFCEVSRAIINTLEKNDYIEIIEKQIERNPFIHKDIKRDKDLQLTNEQKIAYEKIVNSMDNNEFKEFLIYGITGSRKNRNIFTTNKKCDRK